MENPNFALVRKILQSSKYASQSANKKREIWSEIFRTGQVNQADLRKLITEEEERSKKQQTVNKQQTDQPIVKFLNSLDYNGFINFVVTGNIRGEKLLALCSGSEKLNAYCNQSLQVRNAQGKAVGQPQDQYLFRLLLQNMRIPIPFGKTPRKTYIDKTVGGVVLAFGYNRGGELGLGHNEVVVYQPTQIPSLNNIVQVSQSGPTLFLDNQGRVWVTGLDNGGQLGLGDHLDRNIPTLNPYLKNIVQVSGSLCLDNQGKVWAFGNNYIGELGLGDVQNVNIPTMIPTLNNIVQISNNSEASFYLDNQGRVWACGLNERGQLGLGDGSGEYIRVPVLIPNLKDIVQVAAENHTLCLDKYGKVWSFGPNSGGSLGVGDYEDRNVPTLIPTLNNIIQVSVGITTSFCLDNQGRVWSFGDGQDAELGFGDKIDRNVPEMIPNLFNIVEISSYGFDCLCLDNLERVWVFGMNREGGLGMGGVEDDEPQPIGIPTLNPYLNNIIHVTAGDSSFCIQRQ